ncbi:hypothetical protein [Methanococcoides methylutens]|uniref:DUF11 domain-containing protein n=1 Tax=Methanococcoides methylutens MM1 TaxID=1434104 RepID=A0A0E3SRJ1_METMT|nr:hypothetical protein [Methanococcoides methylutens]AKB84938.1 hypothetical protein MCMEM_0885 [Methanococcoides methylutens MM1]
MEFIFTDLIPITILLYLVGYFVYLKVESGKVEPDRMESTDSTTEIVSIKETEPIIYTDNTASYGDENNDTIKILSGFSYKGAAIQYKVKVENPTSNPIADIKVNLYVPDVFILSDSTKHIAILKPSESQTVTFDIRPTGECGDCEVSGKIVYYDYKSNKTTENAIPSKNISIICPMLKSKEISESEWRNALSGLTNAEENTKEIDMPASTLFDVTSDVLQDMNLFMLPPKVNDSDNFYRATSKFYGEGIKELRYAAQIEVVGGSSKSKLILKAWAESEDALTGFYHGILDEIEKRVHVKGLIDNIIVYNHYGDKIENQINDSMIQRSFNTQTKAETTSSSLKHGDIKDKTTVANSVIQHSFNGKSKNRPSTPNVNNSYNKLNYKEVYDYLVETARKAYDSRIELVDGLEDKLYRKQLREQKFIVTYGDVLKRFGKIPENRAHQNELFSILDEINNNTKPVLLSALVVNGNEYLPSKPFFKKWTDNSWGTELKKIWDYYCYEDVPDDDTI